MVKTESNSKTDALVLIADALHTGVPIVAILGQTAGWTETSPDPVLKLALEKVERQGDRWIDLIDREPLDNNFFQWIAERFGRRAPSDGLAAIADIPVSAVFTSSIDPGLPNLFTTNGREPEPILVGSPTPTEVRSTRRPPIFYLFGRAGAGTPELEPPISRQKLSQRRLNHSSAMLLNLKESATALGLIVIDGYCPESDWLRGEDLLAVISEAPKGGVLWFGPDPKFIEDDEIVFQELVASGLIVRDRRSLGEAYAFLRATGEVLPAQEWGEPEIITLKVGGDFVISPRLRLLTEATATIVDNSWTGFLPPFSSELDAAAFQSFHGANIGVRALAEGIRRNYTFEREFESELYSKVAKALSKHHDQAGAIILHGQSGVGKTIAIGRLAIKARVNAQVAVLMVSGSRIPQPSEISPFLEAVGRLGAVTLILIDSSAPVQRYDDLLSALRSGGHKVVIVGTSYKLELKLSRFVHASASLSKIEQEELTELSKRYRADESTLDVKTDHALAKFYWSLPESRGGIADGLSREVRTAETALRIRGERPRPRSGLSSLGLALIAAGYAESFEHLFSPDEYSSELDLSSPGAKVIDYVMAVSRLYKAVPINLLLRTVLNATGKDFVAVDIETLRDLFEGQDLFRWQRGGKDESELLVSSRLQIEAELVCNRRLGTAEAEAGCIIELLKNAYRAGPEDSEESHFATDIVFAMGTDGPARDRYKDSYLAIARCLSALRETHGVRNARLMLQESALRRAYLRTHDHDIDPDEKAIILEEATRAVNDALVAIEISGADRLYAAKRTREYLYTERAATYGFLATDSAQRENDVDVVWASYRAARDAARLATGRVFSYQPLDISLWVPIRVLKGAANLSEMQRAELQADIRATLDVIDPDALPADQMVLFNKQKISASEILSDSNLSDEAFKALEASGSAVGFYLKARAMAPTRPDNGELPSSSDIEAAEKTSNYLMSVLPKVSHDSRSLQLLVSMEWLKATKRWLFRGLRQPLPSDVGARNRIKTLVEELRACDEGSFSPQFRYIAAVLMWLGGETEAAIRSWRTLARDTEYIEARRIANRHTITDSSGKPVSYNGHIVKVIGQGRCSVRVEGLDREVDLQESDFPESEISLGRTVRNFSISFNYRGPIADSIHRRAH